MHSSASPGTDPATLLSDLIRGGWRTLAARAMAELRLADALADPLTAPELARRTGTDADALERLLRTLAGLGLVASDGRRFELTEAGARLRSDVPGSDWGAMMMMAAPWTLAVWQQLPEAVRTGRPVFERANGEPFWDYLRSHEEAGRMFDAAMARGAKDDATSVGVLAELHRSAATVVDVAGGTGRLLARVVAGRPGLRGVLAEQAGPVAGAPEVFAQIGVGDRCTAVLCDFFESVPAGGDAYLLSNILHDWDDERCLQILRRVHEAAAPGAQVLVVENVLPDEEEGVAPDSLQLHLLDLMMLLNFGARERTFPEYTELLEAAGFGDVRLSGQSGSQLVSAVRR